jgi:BNR/Asp-box repeat protein
MFVNKVRLAVTFLAGACAVVGLAVPPASATSSVGPVTDVSSACPGQNAEVEQAVAPPRYVYEAWIGCGGEGFARSVDGGLHFSNPIMLPDSASSNSTFTDDPAVAVAPDGTLYVSWIRYAKHHAYPQVATSFDHGATFPQVRSLIPKKNGNWADRDFIAAGRGGRVYLTEDYGPSIADVKIVCSPSGSCAYGAVDATAVVQTSTDHGKTWGPITPMQPGFPAGGGYDASTLVQPNGVVDALMIDHPLDPGTFKVHPGHELFTRSTDGGKTWSPAVEVGGSAGTLSDTEWWIDGDLSTDRAGNLYATWDTQTSAGDIGWLSYSTDGGSTWAAPTRVTRDQDNAVHIVESAGAGPGIVDIAWQADNSPQGYATYLRPFSIKKGWLAPITRVSRQYGNPAIWPGDTFGISVLKRWNGPGAPEHVALSWGSAVGGSPNSEIHATVVGR